MFLLPSIFVLCTVLLREIRPSGRVELQGIVDMNYQEVFGITPETLQEIQKATDKDSRTLRDFVLSLSKPDVYDFSLRRFIDLSDENFNLASSMLRAFRRGDLVQTNLDQVALLLERSFDPSNSCLEKIGTTSVRVLIAKRQIAKISTKVIGEENAMLRGRWIRDNYLFDNQGSVSIRKRRSPRKGAVKHLSLVSDLTVGRLNFVVTYQGETGRPTTKQFSVLKLGFERAFREALHKAKEEAPELDLQMNNPYKPTHAEYQRFKHIVPDLPAPEAYL